MKALYPEASKFRIEFGLDVNMMEHNHLYRKFSQILLLMALSSPAFSQTILEANGPGDTYELINSRLAPGYNAVENPECIHPEFGRHITEAWDSTLNQYVFEFHIHVTPDNDRCINFDRQRVEIKTYESSPAFLKGVIGETIVYKWKFRLPVGFKASSNFTHLHQIKAVGGDEGDPIFTLTARKGTPSKMELIHNNTTKVATANLSLFEGVWVEVTERVKVDPVDGTYSIEVKNMATGATLLSYSNNKLMTIRLNNSFIRPKWGIYRSLLNAQDLRDEIVRFAGFYIMEDTVSSSGEIHKTDCPLKIFPNPSPGMTTFEYSPTERGNLKLDIYNLKGQIITSLISIHDLAEGTFSRTFDLSFLPDGVYLAKISSGKYLNIRKFVMIKNKN